MDYDLSELITQAQAGDKEALGILCEKNKKLIFYVIKQINYTYNDEDDLSQIGFIGLIKSIKTFDIIKNYEFSTYAVTCIRNEILMFFRKVNKTLSDVSLNQPVSINESGNKQFLEDILEYEDNSSDIELSLDLKNALQKIKPKYRQIINLFYFNNITQKDLAIFLNISQPQVSKIVKTALNSLKIYMTAK